MSIYPRTWMTKGGVQKSALMIDVLVAFPDGRRSERVRETQRSMNMREAERREREIVK